MEAQHLAFHYEEEERSQLCVERQHVSVIVCVMKASRLSPSLMGGYWKFGWEENLNLKKCAYSVACFG